MDLLRDNLNDVLTFVGYNKEGLNTKQVLNSKSQFGTNIHEKGKKTSIFMRFIRQFANFMVIVLLISAIISLVLALLKKNYGDLFESFIIFGIVILNAIIGVIQEKKAEDTLSLLAKKTSNHTVVLREGTKQKILSEEVVVGDIVFLEAGDIVPADIRLIKTTNLKCDESSLTGESDAVFKNADFIADPKAPLAELENVAFSGTSITYGNAEGVVISVGNNTEIGKIATELNKNIKEKSPLEKNIDKIGRVITIGVLIIVCIVFIAQLLFSSKLNLLEAFLVSVALAVAAIPESLPAVITIIMALGVERLAKKAAIVKKLGAVQTLGCCNYLCTDKTGTLTQNNMQVVNIFSNNIISSMKNFNASQNNLLLQAICVCNNATINENNQVIGDATESSLIKFCQNINYNLIKTRALSPRLHEIPFDSTRKIMSTINETTSGTYLFSKGAYDYIVDRCTGILINGKIEKLNKDFKNNIINASLSFTSNAQRVIAVACKPIKNFEKNAKFNKNSEKIEQNLVFLGLLAIFDPPRSEVKTSIKKCKLAGLKPIMITGDHPKTAFAIAKQIGLAKNESEVISGAEIKNLSIKELKKHIENYSVFARVTPEDKVKIVKALKAKGHVVAMTGDGVNDATSIKNADIGISMGTGSDVTKSVADIILTNNDYSSIIIAIEEGRTIYKNIQKTLQFLISTNAVEVLGIFITTIIMKNAVFLLPSQILFINLITDSLPAFALGLEPPEKDVMTTNPIKAKESIFSGEVGTAIIYQAFVQTLVVLIMFVVTNSVYGNAIASTMVFLTICYMQIIHAINCKTNKSLTKINIFANKSFNISFSILFILITLVGFIPPLQTAFHIIPLNIVQWLIVSFASISIIPLVELCKLILHLSLKRQQKTAIRLEKNQFKSG
ncbi:MAG: cation-translocating P-type ATPase [Clostridia bacterium]|nr:cation-translocating P-type ATPase [Clostridia bacterium]